MARCRHPRGPPHSRAGAPRALRLCPRRPRRPLHGHAQCAAPARRGRLPVQDVRAPHVASCDPFTQTMLLSLPLQGQARQVRHGQGGAERRPDVAHAGALRRRGERRCQRVPIVIPLYLRRAYPWTWPRSGAGRPSAHTYASPGPPRRPPLLRRGRLPPLLPTQQRAGASLPLPRGGSPRPWTMTRRRARMTGRTRRGALGAQLRWRTWLPCPGPG